MAYNEISDARVQSGAIANSALFFDLRDNPKGIAAGDSGAPRVVIGALAGPGAGSIMLGATTSNGQLSRANGVGFDAGGIGYQKITFNSPLGYSGFYVQKDGNYRVSVMLSRSSGSTTVSCRMYRNGAAYGAVISTTSSTAYSEDVDFLSGDIIELYIDRNGSSASASIEILGAAYDPAAVRFSV